MLLGAFPPVDLKIAPLGQDAIPQQTSLLEERGCACAGAPGEIECVRARACGRRVSVSARCGDMTRSGEEGGRPMVLVDPWCKAAECDRAIELVADPERRIVLESLRSLWIALSDALSVLDEPYRANQLSTITQIHTELMAVCRTAMH